MRFRFAFVFCFLTISGFSYAREYRIVETFNCPEAKQGVAVDSKHFYAIDNQTITKYSRKGDSISTWTQPNKELIRHFDGGIIIDGLLYCSHSNFSEVPMASSIEVFDPKKMQHVKTIPLGIDNGSCTWVVRGEDCWYVCFAHYDKSGGNAGGEILKGVQYTQIVRYDNEWRRTGGWILPSELIEQLRPHSLSGCIYKDGKFYCTGHDATKLFVLEFPPMGMRLVLSDTIDIPFTGQGIAIDDNGNLWGINRKKRLVYRCELVENK